MTQFFRIHPTNPQPRLISQAVAVLRAGGVIVYPTDSCLALGCHIGEKAAVERICRIRRLDSKHYFTLVCRDLSEVAVHAKVDNAAYRLLRAHTPGPYTFILRATREVPRRLQTRRHSIGLRVPNHPIAQALTESLGEPMMSVSLVLPGDDLPMTDPEDARERVGADVDLVIDGGTCGVVPTTIVDLTQDEPHVVRKGLGDVSAFTA